MTSGQGVVRLCLLLAISLLTKVVDAVRVSQNQIDFLKLISWIIKMEQENIITEDDWELDLDFEREDNGSTTDETATESSEEELEPEVRDAWYSASDSAGDEAVGDDEPRREHGGVLFGLLWLYEPIADPRDERIDDGFAEIVQPNDDRLLSIDWWVFVSKIFPKIIRQCPEKSDILSPQTTACASGIIHPGNTRYIMHATLWMHCKLQSSFIFSDDDHKFLKNLEIATSRGIKLYRSVILWFATIILD